MSSVGAFERWSLNEWKKMFKEVYAVRNLPLTPSQTLHRLIEETAELVKPVLTLKVKDLEWHLVDVFAWVCAFGDKLDLNLDQLLFKKYAEEAPGKQKKLPPYGIISKDKPENLDDWQTYLKYVYRDENENIPPDFMLSRLMEDIGETSRALRKGQKLEIVEDKLAGVLGWTIAIANKFEINIGHATWGKYPNMCWKCHAKPCKCSKLSRVFISYSVETKDDMSMVKSLLEELKLGTIVFEQLGPAFRRTRMVEAFNAINVSDGAIILMGKKWSVNVYAEMIEILRALDEQNVWICAMAAHHSEREPKQSEILGDIEQFHQIHYYPDSIKLIEMLRHLLTKRLQELREISA